MRFTSPPIVAILATAASCHSHSSPPPVTIAMSQAPDVTGEWKATLTVNGMSLRLMFQLSGNADATLHGEVRSLDQGNAVIPLSIAKYDAAPTPTLTLELKPGGATFVGHPAKTADGLDSWVGTMSQGGQMLPMTLERGSFAQVQRPQEPRAPFPYRAEDVTFDNRAAKVTLAGTLTLPDVEKTPGKRYRAVILITGSGPQNRDEELLGHKPFWVLADHLTRAGIAVLRYDDRGTAKSTGNFATSTTFDFADDAAAALAYLRSRDDIDPADLGLLGHSEGAEIAPMLAARDPHIAFIVMIGGPGVTGEQISVEQGRLIALASGVSPDAQAVNSSLQKTMFELALKNVSPADATPLLKQAIAVQLAALSQAKRDETLASLTKDYPSLLAPWIHNFLSYDPAPALTKVHVPVLALYGEHDLQVPPAQNIPPVKAALANNPHAVIKILPGLNHLMQTSSTGTGLPSEYQTITETMSPIALDAITAFILAPSASPH